MNRDLIRTLQLSLSGAGRWIVIIGILWLLSVIGVWRVLQSIVILVGLLVLIPILAMVGLQWWLKRNLVSNQCPVCQANLIGLNQTEMTCPSCGELLTVEHSEFHRSTPPGTIDIDAVEISPSSKILDSRDS